MVRNYIRKTDRATKISSEKLQRARALVEEEGLSIRAAATAQGLDRSTLTRFLSSKEVGYDKCSSVRQIFTNTQEKELADHVQALDNRFHGLSTLQLKRLAFDYGNLNNIKIPMSWTRDKQAGKFSPKLLVMCLCLYLISHFILLVFSSYSIVMSVIGKDWLRLFMSRHNLSVRAPESTSLARQAAFNRMVVKQFFTKLGEVLER